MLVIRIKDIIVLIFVAESVWREAISGRTLGLSLDAYANSKSHNWKPNLLLLYLSNPDQLSHTDFRLSWIYREEGEVGRI